LIVELGRVIATPGALAALMRTGNEVLALLVRHANADRGTVDAEDWRANDHALVDGTRLLSAYTLHDGSKIWIITEADRSVTTILLPEEY
jgi:hypothetical protein